MDYVNQFWKQNNSMEGTEGQERNLNHSFSSTGMGIYCIENQYQPF